VPFRYRKHYTRNEARGLLPEVKLWLARILDLKAQLQKSDDRLTRLMSSGNDIGGEAVNRWVSIIAEIREVLMEFHRRDIQIKDVERGLIDFPAIIAGKEVFLCWEQDEDDIEFWHDLDAGFAGREKLSGGD
jgi:hypothetical protein